MGTLLLLAVLARGAEPAALRGVDDPLRLVWVDIAGVSWFAFDVTTRRVGQVLAPGGIAVIWSRRQPGESGPAGGVSVALMPPRTARPARLGATGSGSEDPPGVWVYPTEVAAALRLPRRNPVGWTPLEQRELAEALGIVIAHELVHVLAGPGHGASRLMARRLSRRDLLDRTLVADPTTLVRPADLALGLDPP